MRDLLGKNLIYKIVAVFLAVVLWLNASDQDISYRQQVVEVPLEVRGLSISLVASELPKSVNVRVEGELGVVDRLRTNQFSAFVRLDSYEAGTHRVPVEVTIPTGVRLINITPSSVAVTLTEMGTKQLPVVASVRGGAAPGFRVLNPVIEPAEVIVSGPEDILKGLRSAVVRIELNNVSQNYVRVLPVTLNSDADLEVSIKPNTVKVTIPVVAENQSKTVPVEAVIQGTPPEGVEVGTVQVEPKQVEISGAPDVIDSITSIKTRPVDLTGREDSFTENARLEISESVQVLGRTEVSVTVELIKKEQEPEQKPGE
jgi:YbbR domain-containing protein